MDLEYDNLVHRLARLRTALRFSNDPRTDAILREVIAEMEEQLAALQRASEAPKPSRRSTWAFRYIPQPIFSPLGKAFVAGGYYEQGALGLRIGHKFWLGKRLFSAGTPVLDVVWSTRHAARYAWHSASPVPAYRQ
jgi:hypothetical protein